MSADDKDLSTHSVTCAICGTVLATPGFDPSQTAQALARHIAANHAQEANAAANEAAAKLPREQDDAKDARAPVGEHAASPVTDGNAQNALPAPVGAPPTTASESPETEDDPPSDTDTHTDDEPASGAEKSSAPDTDIGSAAGNDKPVDPSPEHSEESRGPRRSGPARPQVEDGMRRSTGAPANEETGTRTQEATVNGPAARGSATRGPAIPAASPAPTAKGPRRGGDGRQDDREDDRRRKDGTGRRPDGIADPLKQSVGKRDGKAPANAGGRTGAVKNAGKRIEEGVTKGIQAAGASVGVPPLLTKVAIRFVKKGLPLLLAAVMVFAVALFGGTLTENGPEDTVWDVPLSEQLDIPEPYLEAYRSAARAQKLPWTLLAAIGANASYHGRIDPYKQQIPLPAARIPSDDTNKKVIVLTDSSLVEASTYLTPLLTPTGYQLEIVEVEGGSIAGGVEWLEEYGTGGSTLVVALGANETGTRQEFADQVNRLMNTLGLHNRVLWLTLDRGASPGVYNEVLRDRDANRPNLRLIDWAGRALDRGFTPDGTGNYTDEAERERAGLIAASVAGNAVSAGLPVSADLTGPGVLPTPTGDCPTLPVAIAGETPSQGAGPLMLMPSALVAAGYDLGEKIQNICESADTLAEVLADTARAVAEEDGTSFPRGIAFLAQQAGSGDAEAAKQVHDFWAKVVDRAGVLGSVEERECLVPEQGSLEDREYVGNAIDAYWRCALANVELSSISAVNVDAAGNVSYSTLEPAGAVARSVDEALVVAWNWSEWGGANCDEEAVHAGVFPLTLAVFEEYAEDTEAGRCDPAQNIIAAAEAFISGESAPAATRPGRWNASSGGWRLIGPVAGPVGPGLFDTLGPWQPLSVGTECSRVLVSAVLAAARDQALLPGLTAGQAQELAYAGLTDEFDTTGQRAGGAFPDDAQRISATSGLDARLESLVSVASVDPACAQTRPYTAEEWMGALAGAVNGDALTSAVDGEDLSIPARTTGNLLVPASAGDRVTMLSGRAFSRSAGYPGVSPSSSAYLQRLSSVRVALKVRPVVESEQGANALSLGYRMINVAVGYYGGIFVGNTGEALAGFGFLDDSIPYFEEFNSVGQEYGIDPRLLAAVAKQESNFDPEAGCPTEGAFGMMQKEFDTVPTLCGDVRGQIAAAAEMLLDLYRRAGDWKGALWGYNNGALFSEKWAEINGESTAAEEYAYEWYRGRGVCSATGECRRAEIAMEYISETPGDRSAMLNWIEYQRLFPSSVIGTRQTIVNGNECPNVAPLSAIAGRTVLRDGAETIGIRELCVEAVAEAPSPEAARAIIFAFNNLGITYSQELRSTPRAFDCSSYVSRAYESSGLIMNNGGVHFSTHSLFPHSGYSRPEWVVPIALHAARPGDLVFPSQGHVAMVLTRGFIIHTNATGDVSKVERGYANPLQVNRVVPEVAPRRGG